ncbi:MAG: hypothetical protein MUP36_03090 [Demequinaceae bacterium]|nr:hypothetical protein [Demequinaceae bacterium]
MTEWWQKDEGDVPIPVPRRDTVPGSGFSDPRDVTSTPELAHFVPEFRVRRRKYAVVLTLIAVAMMGGWVAVLVEQYGAEDLRSHTSGAWTFLYFGFVLAGVGFALWRIWRWANQRDPRDFKGRGR